MPGVVAVERGLDGGGGVACIGRQIQRHDGRRTDLADDLRVRDTAPDQACARRQSAQVRTKLQRGNRIRACRKGDGILGKVRVGRRTAASQVLVIQRQGDDPAVGARDHRAGTIGHRDGVRSAAGVVVAILGTECEVHVHAVRIVQIIGGHKAPCVVGIDRQRALAGVDARAVRHRLCSASVDRDREVGRCHTIGACRQVPRPGDGCCPFHRGHRSRQRHHRHIVHNSDNNFARTGHTARAHHTHSNGVSQCVIAITAGMRLSCRERVFIADGAILVASIRDKARDFDRAVRCVHRGQ